MYLWSKFFKKLAWKSVKNSKIHSSSKIAAHTSVISSSIDKQSYCGYYCKIESSEIGSYCSISDYVMIGGATHPLTWVSTSPAFYMGDDGRCKKLATLHYNDLPSQTKVGHDVWIGHGVHIKAGVTIGTGAVIGMGSVVTKDVPPYAIVAGNPATIIRKRFDDITIAKLLESKWWDKEAEELQALSRHFDDVNNFLSRI